ncbi:MAG TPA: TonB-dependent receptor [Xanthomonadaceae bacterium]|nr:TonB-dependent receptor [Xanthomonadaceae bacterium]
MTHQTHSHPFRRNLLAVALAAGLPCPAFAQAASQPDATDLGAVVVTAAGFEQKLTDAPASISIVTREDLDKRPYMTLIDAVRDLEGVDVGETSDKTGQRTISMRGMGSDYTLVLIDGKRQNNHGDIYPNAFGGNQFNHIPPLDTIERIEVIRGPASTLYGADAMGGVINIITRKVTDTWTGSATFGRSFQQDRDFGDDITFDFAASGPLLKDVLGLSVRGAAYERLASNPEYAPVTDPNGTVHTRSLGFGGGGRTVDNTNRTAGVTLNWTPTANQSLSFDYDVSRQEYDNTPIYDPETGETSYPLGTLDGIDSIWRATRGVVQPRVGYTKQQKFDRDNWALTHQGEWGFGRSFVSLAYVETSNNGRSMPFSPAERDLLQAMYSGTGAYAGLSTAARQQIAADTFLPRSKRALESNQYTLDAKLDIPVEGLAGRHHFIVGGQVIDGELEDGVFGLESGTATGAVQEQKMWSLFAEDNWTPLDPLTVTVGVRYDDHDIFGGHVSPRAYAVYDLAPNWTVKGGVSTGYKTPKTTDLYDGITGFGGQGTSPWAGNPDLEPETSVNSEIALYWTSSDDRHNFNLTYFHNDFEDKIASGETTRICDPAAPVRPCVNLGEYGSLGYTTYTQVVNIDEARIQGVEIAGRYGIGERLSLRANYTWTDSEQLSGADEGLPLTNTAEHMANATLDWSITERFSAQLTLEARSDRYRGKDAGNQPLYYKDYQVLHLGAQYRVNDHVTLTGRINNLLDEDFTSYRYSFNDLDGDGLYSDEVTGEVVFTDDYNNKDKARNFWLSVNARF